MIQAPDLRKQFPRSPAELLGGFAMLARAIDKCRAALAGTNGEYHFNCPLDKRLFDFTDIEADEFKNFVAKATSDDAIVAWARQKAAGLSESEIAAWSYDFLRRGPVSIDEKAYFETLRRKVAPDKPYVSSWAELLDAEEGRV
jgi:hypothetical protein